MGDTHARLRALADAYRSERLLTGRTTTTTTTTAATAATVSRPVTAAGRPARSPVSRA